jgi:putative tricarboxylic transport membrane protein
MNGGGGRATGEIVLGIALAIAGVLLLIGTTSITVAPVYSRIGPRVFPFLVAGGLIAVGLLYAFESWKGRQTPTDEHKVTFWPIAVISGGIVADALLLERLGFVLSSTILFILVAAGFGSRRHLRNAVVALALASLAYITFVYGLGLRLPAGILAGWS